MSNQDNIRKYIKILNIIINQLDKNNNDEITEYVCKTTNENIEVIKNLYYNRHTTNNLEKLKNDNINNRSNLMHDSKSDSDSDSELEPKIIHQKKNFNFTKKLSKWT
jgi:hypothetical protein